MSGNPVVQRRILLLSSQAFALGLTIAWVTIPANTIFLESFGPSLLPYTYIGAAAAGAAASVLLARALRKRPLANVAMRLLATVSVALVAVWLVVWLLGATWLSFAVLVLLPLMIPVGFMFVVGQAGMLLDVRVLKVLYPRVIAGFALGFAIGGLAAAPLLGLLGGAEQLFAAAAAAALALLALVLLTLRTFPSELAEREPLEDGAGEVTLRSLVSHRFVALIMAFQMLSAVESQWLDYLMYDRAAQRYPDSADLAQFIGRFSAITYGTDIVFLLVIAGVLLRRFGLRLGLMANSAVVLTMVLAVLAATAVQGSGATLVFILIVATRVSDLVLSDGTSRTSVSTAYQAVPGRLRLASQANVESLGVPVAIGFSGVVLLLVQATVGTDGPLMFVLVAAVVTAWLACAIAIYSDYRANLLDNLRHRLLEPGDLTADGSASVPAVERLLASDDARDVRLGIATLASLGHPDLVGHLERLASEGRPDVHAHVVDQLATAHPERAADVARAGLDHAEPFVRAAGLSTLAQLGREEDARAAAALLHDPDPAVVRAAAAVMSRLGSAVERSQVDALVSSLATSDQTADRVEAGELLARCSAGPWLDRTVLAGVLLLDPEPAVAASALAAVDWSLDEQSGPVVIDLLGRRGASAAAAEALVRGGAPVLPLLDACLGGSRPSGPARQTLCARVCRDIGGAGATEVLQRHATLDDRDAGLAVVRALAALVGEAGDPATAELAATLVAADLRDAARLLLAGEQLDGIGPAGPLRLALGDEALLARRRVLADLALRHGVEAIDRVEFQLSQPNPRIHAMAMEWLDVTLAGPARGAMILLDPALSAPERARAMAGAFGVATRSPADLIRDLAEDPNGWWRRPWIGACAIIAAAECPEADLDLTALGAAHLRDADGIFAETLRGVAAREHSRG